MQGQAEPQLRAWVEYFRDLGVHDFYRRGEFAPSAAKEADGAPLVQLNAASDADAVALSADSVEGVVESPGIFAEEAAPASDPMPQPLKLISFNDLAPVPAGAIPAADRAGALRAIQDEIGDCTRCPLAYAGRHKIVFGDGSATARLMFVGEGPGADEDAQGLPFVGKAGQLLNNMIAAMGLARADVYIANIVKCRPPGNRVPEPVEANTCSPFLLRQIDVVQPEVIVALGATAAMYLLGVKQSLSSLRGRWHNCRGAKLAVTYHPAFLLRDPRQKAEAWKDLQIVMGELGLTAPKRG
jgi:DNA polymerase